MATFAVYARVAGAVVTAGFAAVLLVAARIAYLDERARNRR